MDIYSIVGFVGMACIIGAYAYLTSSKAPNPYILHGTNLMGAALLTVQPRARRLLGGDRNLGHRQSHPGKERRATAMIRTLLAAAALALSG